MPKGIPGSRPLCSVPGCGRPHWTRGWCTRCYQRWVKHGDPLWTRRAEAERNFWARVQKAPDGCWRLTGYLNRGGYGMFGHGGRRAHRFALEQALGRPLLPGMQALHTCDVPCCVRNDEHGFYEVNGVLRPRRGHLWEGTTQDNTADKTAKGRAASGTRNGVYTHPERYPRGEAQWLAKLTEDQVRAIRRRAASGERQTDLAIEYGVGRTNITKIVHRVTWKHV